MTFDAYFMIFQWYAASIAAGALVGAVMTFVEKLFNVVDDL